MPRIKYKVKKIGKKRTKRYLTYIKTGQKRQFYEAVHVLVELKTNLLPKGRNFLHYAAKYDDGLSDPFSLTECLIGLGESGLKTDFRGDLPVDVALRRALKLPPAEASTVYWGIIKVLIDSFPRSLKHINGHGKRVCDLVDDLKFYLNRHNTDTFHHERESSPSSGPDDDWSERLAREFESESADFYGRYDNGSDWQQEEQTETYSNWAERIRREMHARREKPQCSASHKRKHSSTDHTDTPPKIPKASSTVGTREKIHAAKNLQNMNMLRETYETRFQAALEDQSGKKLGFGDIPWPSRGSMQNVMDILFGDKTYWTDSDLKKFAREQRVRWHPDKFLQKFGDRIAPKSLDKVMEKVKEISQALNEKVKSLFSE